jgi:hypothetical protein
VPGEFQLAVSHTAPTGELLTSPIFDGKGQPSQELNQYGVGVDCHSSFFQVCLLIPKGRELRKIERKVPARWNELRAAQAWVLRVLRDTASTSPPANFAIPASPLASTTCRCAWRGGVVRL